MKRKYFIPALLLLSAVSVLGLRGEAQAAKKQAVKVQVKKGTLTISGKGAMPSKLNVKKKSKIKKVVIKKGVTSISNHAFENYKNLKTVSIPKTVKKIGWDSFRKTAIQKLTVPSSVTSIGQNAFSSMSKLKKLTVPGKFTVKTKGGDDTSYYVCKKVDTVAFNTNLTLKNSVAFICNRFEAYKKDTNYTSINGMLYTKDKKAIVRVPKMRKTVEIANGCEIFSLQSILAANVDFEGDSINDTNYQKIIIPESVKQVEVKKYAGTDMTEFTSEEKAKITLEIRSRQLDGTSLCELMEWLGATVDSLQKALPEQIQKKNNMYISSDGVLMKYVGKEKEITVPEYIKKVGPYAFCNVNTVESLKLPEGLTEVGDYAFYRCADVLKDNELVVNFPSSLRVIGEHAFALNPIKKLSLPDTITSYGNYAFADTSITEVKIPETVQVISEGLFSGTLLKKIVIPDSVEKIENRAFSDCHNVTEIKLGKAVREIGDFAFDGVKFTDIILPESVTKVGFQAFGYSWAEIPPQRTITISGSSKGIDNAAFCTPNDCLIYSKSTKEMRTFFDSFSESLTNKKATVTFSCNKVKGASGYQTVFSTDKNFKKNTKKLTFRTSGTMKKIIFHLKKNQIKKGMYHSQANIYGKIRPYKIVNGKKVYGTWTVTTFECLG